jgi:Sulfatase
MAVGWAWAFDTPFKWTKQVASHFGGTRQGLAISWPGHIKDVGGIRTQFHHVIDIVPTIFEATGIQAPEVVNGIEQKPIEGVSMAYTFDQANANASSKRETQYFEMAGNRAIYHDGWIAATTPPAPPWVMGTAKMPEVVNGYQWELYNIAEDYSEYDDLAAKNPDKLHNLQALFLVEAAKYNVFPLDNSAFTRLLTPKPSTTAGRTVFTYSGENSGIPVANAPSILDRDYTITAEVTIPESGAEGMIVTLGGRFGGYGLYLLKGKPVFDYNLLNLQNYRWEGGLGARDWLGSALQPGEHTIVFDFKYDGPGPGKGGTGVLTVDGKELARKTIPHTIPLLMSIDETFDVGIDTRTAVDDSYNVPFRFTGTISKLTFKLGPEQLTPADQMAAAKVLAQDKD